MAEAIVPDFELPANCRWVVLRFSHKGPDGKRYWLCRCPCGLELAINSSRLRSGATRCCHRCAITKHGKARSPEYGNWKAMVQRCTNPNHASYPEYGGRGITVCDRWMTFADFHADVGDRPAPNCTLHRLNGSEGYRPGNVVWAAPSVQNRNTARNVFLTHDGETLTVTDWSARVGIPIGTIQGRLRRRWSVADALTVPVFALMRHRGKQVTPDAVPVPPVTPAAPEAVPATAGLSTPRNSHHGLYKSAEYRAWGHMKDRCLNPRCKAYPDYGGRGITVCPEWAGSFGAFYADMGARPSPRHELDRIDNGQGYSPGNCRWALRGQQMRNTRQNHLITYAGVTMCLTDWAKHIGIGVGTLTARINVYGWSAEKALTTPAQRHARRK
jgi:hypothetical protein